MNSSLGIKIAAAAGVVLLLVLYARSGHRPTENPEPAVTSGSLTPRNQVEERLQQLHAAHDRSSRRQQAGRDEGSGAKIEAHSGLAANSNRVLPPHGGADSAANAANSRNAPNARNARKAPEANEEEDSNDDVDPDDLPALQGIAVRDSDPERRLAAVTMLGASEDPSVIPTLAQALSDEDDEVRLAAIQSLSDFTGDAPIDLLSKVAVDDPSADNRYEALEALSDLGGDRAASAIQKALNDPDEDVRALAEGLMDNEDTFQENTPEADAAPNPVPPSQKK